MASDRPHARREIAAALAVFAVLQGCSTTPGDGSESHFQGCETDADCAEAGAARYCVSGRCTSVAPGDAAAGGAGSGGASSDAAQEGDASRAEAGTGGTTAAGAGGTSTGDASTGGAPICRVPALPIPERTPLEQERAALIHAYCVTLMRDECLGVVGGSSFIGGTKASMEGCSSDEVLLACKQDRLYEYVQQVPPPCDDKWRAAVTCAAAAAYPAPEACTRAGLYSSGGVRPCDQETTSLRTCLDANPPPGAGGSGASLTGTRTSCGYQQDEAGVCRVNYCWVGTNSFHLECSGPDGLPLRCSCSVNGHVISSNSFGYSEIYAVDCADAAARAANGTACTNSLDCCFSYPDGGVEQCRCGSDPRALGYPTCEAVATAVGGQVVPSCPQFELSLGGCWPPPCAG